MIGALFAAAIGLAQAAAIPAAPVAIAPAAAKPTPSDLVCHSEPDPGSRFTHKVCIARAQLQDRRMQNQQLMEDLHQQGQLAPMMPAMMGPTH